MSVLADKLKSVEDEETLSILSDIQDIPHRNMSLLFLGTYSVGLLHSYTPTANERQALNRLTRARVNPVLLFHRLYTNRTLSSMADQEASVIVQSAAFRMEDLNCLS